MTKRSRILTFILTLLLTLSVFSAVAFADSSDGVISVTASAITDGKVTATISISGNPGISGMSLKLSFDRAKLTPVSFDASKGLYPQALSNMTDETPVDLTAIDTVTYFFATHSEIAKNGELFRVTFEVSDNAVGTTDIGVSYAKGGITNSRFGDLAPDTKSCTVDISGAKYPGGVISLESEHLGLDYYRVTVGLFGNPGIASLNFKLELSPSIVLRSVDLEGIFDNVTSNATQPGVLLSELDRITYNFTSTENRTDVGTLFSFTFRLIDGYGSAIVSYENGDVVNSATEALSPHKSSITFGRLDVATVIFDANTDVPLESDVPAPITNVKNSYVTLPICPGRQDKAYFIGWAETNNASVATYKAGDKLLLTRSLTLYAVWSIRTYTVSYDANGGSGAPAAQVKIHGVGLSLSDTVPTRANYEFGGWSVSPDGAAADYNSRDVYAENISVTLYAVWRPHSYKITFDANGGSGAPVSTEKFYGIDATLPSGIPAKSGFGFAGWSDSKTGSVKYLPGAVYTANGNATLYAVWTTEKYDVTFDANGGINTPSVHSLAKNLDLIIPLTIPEKTGYTFLGWSESRTATAPDYLIGEKYTRKSSVTLYAVWEVARYTLTFDVNGGTGSIASVTFTFGTSATLPASIPSRIGHTFLGWSENAGASTAEFKAGASYSYNRSALLYAVWSPDRFAVTFNANGGTNTPKAQEKLYDIDLRLSAVKPQREGFKFIGWAEAPNALEAKFAAGALYTENRKLTLYAVWAPITYTVRYEANNTTGDYQTATKTHGTDLFITSYYPTRSGFVFLGWAYTPNALTPDFRVGDRYTTESDAIFYAVWTVKEYTVLYDANGGSLAPGAQKKIHGVPLTIVNVKADRSGYVFIGWSTAPDGAAVEYMPGDVYEADADTTLYAIWCDAASAANTALSVKSIGGGKVKVEILLTANPSINSLALRLDFDRSKVKLKEIERNEDDEPLSVLNGMSVNFNIDRIPEDTSYISLNWFSTSNKKTTGVILTAIFDVLCEAGDKAEFALSIAKETTNASGKKIPTGVETVTFTVPDYMPGDLNDDGIINAKDSVLLAQHLASWAVEMNKDAADCNGDGVINAKDSVLLAQYLANWDVSLG